MENFPLELPALLAWVLSPAGSWFLVSWFASWALEKWQKWADLGAGVKKGLMLGLALALAAGAQYLLNSPGILEAISPTYTFIATFIAGWLTLETVHKANKALSKPAE